eukprot:c19427_g3_i1.p2 GENE.c19427_g3_i1~~c19427_g3_i1.p2  ORF type:complete len:228 (+),score=66.72 c19427_g3_i1:33-686(+)
MSKVSGEHLRECVKAVLVHANETKKRKFVETVELQIGLKNYDTRKDKRFKGQIRLNHMMKPNMKICILGNVKHCDAATALGFDSLSEDRLKNFKRDKKLVKDLAAKYDAFLASDNLIKQIPRLLGPGLNKAGKFPSVITNEDSLEEKILEIRSTVKFQLKKVMCLNTAIGNVTMSEGDLQENIVMSINFLVSLLKKQWQNVKSLTLKSTMGPAQSLY